MVKLTKTEFLKEKEAKRTDNEATCARVKNMYFAQAQATIRPKTMDTP